MKYHPIFPVDPFNLGLRRSLLQFGHKIDQSCLLRKLLANEEYMLKDRQFIPFDTGQQGRRCHDSHRTAVLQPVFDGSLHKCFKERPDNCPYLQRAKHADIQLWASWHKYKNTVALAYPVIAEHIRKLVRQRAQFLISVGFIPRRIAEQQSRSITFSCIHMTVDRFISHIDPPCVIPGELLLHIAPIELGASFFVTP
ncbi:hypothetical protein D3C77_404100 [compost metagenome]